MILAYHVIFTTYGTWLPNDPRGSYSDHVYLKELRDLGEIKYGRQDPQPPKSTLKRFWTATKPHLPRPPYFINNSTRPIIASAFESVIKKFDLTVPACAIMNDHVHILVLPSSYRIEYITGQLKGAATRALGLTQTPWAQNAWKVYINDENALLTAVKYLESNPICARLSPQSWSFVKKIPSQ